MGLACARPTMVTKTLPLPSDRELFLYAFCFLSRVGNVVPHLIGRKTYRHSVVVDGNAEDRHDDDVPAERDNSNAGEICWAEIAYYRQTDEVRPQTGAPPPVEGRGHLRRVDNVAYGEEHEAKAHRDEHLPEYIPRAPVDDQVRHDEGDRRQHLAERQPEWPRMVRL